MFQRETFASWLLLLPLVGSACRSSSSPSTGGTAPSTTPTIARLSLSRTTYNFPNTVVGDTATSSAIDVSAAGSGSLTVTSITSSDPTEFALPDAANCVGMALSAATACHITVNFKPAAAGVRTAQITLAGSDGGNVLIAVFGDALAPASSGGGSTDGSGSGATGGGSGGSTGTSSGSFPQPPCVPNYTQNITLSIVNTMTFSVQVSVDGPTHQTSAIAPFAIQLYPLQPGNYTIGGSAPGSPNVTFSASTWTVVSGCDYLMQVVAK